MGLPNLPNVDSAACKEKTAPGVELCRSGLVYSQKEDSKKKITLKIPSHELDPKSGENTELTDLDIPIALRKRK